MDNSAYNGVDHVPFGYCVYFGGGNAASRDAVIAVNTLSCCFDVETCGFYSNRCCRDPSPCTRLEPPACPRTANVTIVRNRIARSSPAGVALNTVAIEGAILKSNMLLDAGSLADVGSAPLCLACRSRNSSAADEALPSIWTRL